MSSTNPSEYECSLLPLIQSPQYISGSLSNPMVHPNNSSSGEGVFEWPSGLKYIGEFVERKRHGYGIQLWPDGAKYEGQFYEDQRQGSGRHIWSNGEEYDGEYQRDRKHGQGIYRWPSGAYVTGQFNQDRKEGFCVYVSPDGEKFEGMYHDDVRDGDGVLTYPGGRQDVGTWQGIKLLKLHFTVKEACFDPTSCDLPLKSPDLSLGSPDIKERGNFGPKGKLEVASEELLQAASNGDVAKVTSAVKAGVVHVDVADSNGHTALFAAATHGHPAVINVLLDNGADVNKLDTIGVTALNACYHLLYCSLPQVKTLLEVLPRLQYLHTAPSRSHSVTLTDCTLHTCDFSSPHSHQSRHHNPPIDTCTGEHKSLPQNAKDMCAVKSYPQISATKSDTEPLYFSSLNNFSTGQDPTNTSMKQTTNNGEHSNTRKSASDIPISTEQELNHTPNMSVAIVEADKISHLHNDMLISRPLSSALEDTPLNSALGHLNSSLSATASTNGHILGVSPLSPDFLTSSKAEFHDDNEINGISDLPNQGSASSLESLSDVSVTMETPDDKKQESKQKQLSEDSENRQQPAYNSNRLSVILNRGADSPLLCSSVFSSTQYGPIISAAQSTTLSCGSGSLVEYSTASGSSQSDLVEAVKAVTPMDTIALLLKRGADPNVSSLPLTPLIYAIRSGDVEAVKQLVKRRADVNQSLPAQVGGYSVLIEAVRLVGPNPVAIIELLLKHGARVNNPSHTNNTESTTTTSLSLAEVAEDNSTQLDESTPVIETKATLSQSRVEDTVLAGENRGESQYSPLHMACSHREHPEMDQKQLSTTVLAMVDLLLGGGANVNLVAMGHSPLSLAIMNGHNKVVEKLLSHGADPNLPLGHGVGTALCSLTTQHALRKNDSSASFKMVGQLLQYGACFTQPVRVAPGQELGTVTDFAYAALKEDKKLSCLKYSALNKAERSRYRVWKKLLENFIHLFKCKALHTVALRENPWLLVQIQQQKDNKLHTNKLLQIRRGRLLRTSSVIHIKTTSPHKRARNIYSADGVSNKSRSKADILPNFPIHTLSCALKIVIKHHGATLKEGPLTESEGESSKSKGHEKRLQQLKELFASALEMFQSSTYNQAKIDNDSKEKAETDSEEKDLETDLRENSASNCSSSNEPASKWTFSCFCYECGQCNVRLVKCPGCQTVYYCSQACRVESHRKGHREECSVGFLQQTPNIRSKQNIRKIHSAAL